MQATVAFDGNILSVKDLLTEIGYSGLANSSDAHLRTWFRGQANKIWRLEPGVYRASFPETTEEGKLHLERKLVQGTPWINNGTASA